LVAVASDCALAAVWFVVAAVCAFSRWLFLFQLFPKISNYFMTVVG